MKTRFLYAASLLLLVAACKDPAKDSTKATTTEAITTTTQASATPGATATYAFDQTNSKVEWTGSKVTGKHDGSFETFKGTVKLVDGSPEKSSVNVEIDTATIRTEPAMLLNHLKSDDFFAVDKFPKATFTSTEVKKGGEKGATHTVTGNLTLHGVTKGISFPATIKVEGDKVDVGADFAINRKDFGLNYPGKKDDLIRDDVVIRLKIDAKKS